MDPSIDENNTSYDDHLSLEVTELSLSYPLRFWLLLSFDIPALMFTLIVLFYLLSNRTQRRSLNNHTFILLLCLTLSALFIDIPFYLNYIRLGYVWPDNPTTCYIWWYISISFSGTSNILMSFASFERHVLIFHDRWILTRTKRFLFHYLPHIIILTYGFTFYSIGFFSPSCENVFIYTMSLCSAPCYYFVKNLFNLWDVFVNGVLPPLIISLFNIFLLIRVIYQKHIRLHQPITWKKHRRMTIQVLSVSSLYLTFMLPPMVVALMKVCGYSTYLADTVLIHTYFFAYFIPILLPFICLGTLPDLRKKLGKIFLHPFSFRNQTRIQPFNQRTKTLERLHATNSIQP